MPMVAAEATHMYIVIMKLNGRTTMPHSSEYVPALEVVDTKLLAGERLTIPKRLDAYVSILAETMAPKDIETEMPRDMDEAKGLSKALSYGAILGYHITNNTFYPTYSNSDDFMHPTPSLKTDGTKSQADWDMNFGHYLIHESEEGLAQVDERVTAWLEVREGEIIDEVLQQRYVRVGCGIVILAARKTLQKELDVVKSADLESLQVDLDNGEFEATDWDGIDWSLPSKNQ